MTIHAIFCAHDAPDNYAGGPNAWLQRLLPDLLEDGIKVTTLVIGKGPMEKCPLASVLQAKGVSVRFLDSRAKPHMYLEQKLRWLVGQLNELKPDVFVPNLMIPAYYAAAWARKAGIPSIGVVHSNDDFYHHLLETFVYGSDSWRVNAAIAVSDYLHVSISKEIRSGVLLHNIPYGVPIPEIVTRPVRDGLRIAYVGRFRQEQKRILDVTESFCTASKALPNAVFTLLGNGPEKEGMARIIDRYEAGKAVLIQDPMPQSKVQGFMQSQDVFVLLSDYEGLPIALQEAMAVGMVPVCLKEESGINELVRNGENGLVVRDRGEDFIEALCRLDADRDLLNRLSANARKTIESDYSSDQQHKKWSALLQQVAEKEGQKRRIRLPLFLRLPSAHPDFRGEDRLAPSHRERAKKRTKVWAQKVRLMIRPRERLRQVWRALTSKV